MPEDNLPVYIAGNQNELGNWNASKVALNKLSPTHFRKIFYFDKGTNLEFKFTKGSWLNEALDSLDKVPSNHILTVSGDTIVNVIVKHWQKPFSKSGLILSSNLLNEVAEPLIIRKGWFFHPGDNPVYADYYLIDSSWKIVSSNLNRSSKLYNEWNGIGWFRCHLQVDSLLRGKTIALGMDQLGASEIYLNGRLIYKFGVVSLDKKKYNPVQVRGWRSITLDSLARQVIAVRYASLDKEYLNGLKFNPGFDLYLLNINTALSSYMNSIKISTINQVLFTAVPLVLAILHLLLYLFYPVSRQNLFYAVCLFGFSLLAFANFQKVISEDPGIIILFYRLSVVGMVVAIAFGLFTTYAGNYLKFPKQFYLFAGAAVLLAVYGFIKPNSSINLFYIFIGISSLEMIRVLYKPANRSDGAWIIGIGFAILISSVLYQILLDNKLVEPPGGIFLVYGYGVIGLILSMSVYLSYNFAGVNKNLALQLENVKQLSLITIDQERKAKELEIEQRLLEEDNKRKTAELEEARQLQLSLLPKEIPQLPFLEIAVYMKTATEVGGDYYDFHLNDINNLTVVIGDATGHGARAGTMVSAIKSLFQALADETETLTILQKCTRSIKAMNLHNLYMCLSVLKISKGKVIFSNAGMPPAYFYKKKSDKVELVIQKTMPLGSFINFPYIQEEIIADKDDILILLSDGFIECFNSELEMIGSERTENLIKSISHKSSNEIINEFKCAAEEWGRGAIQADDITLVVIKFI